MELKRDDSIVKKIGLAGTFLQRGKCKSVISTEKIKKITGTGHTNIL